MAIGLTRQQISQLQLPEFHPEFGRLRSREEEEEEGGKLGKLEAAGSTSGWRRQSNRKKGGGGICQCLCLVFSGKSWEGERKREVERERKRGRGREKEEIGRAPQLVFWHGNEKEEENGVKCASAHMLYQVDEAKNDDFFFFDLSAITLASHATRLSSSATFSLGNINIMAPSRYNGSTPSCFFRSKELPLVRNVLIRLLQIPLSCSNAIPTHVF
jgi:hypothetical protein